MRLKDFCFVLRTSSLLHREGMQEKIASNSLFFARLVFHCVKLCFTFICYYYLFFGSSYQRVI